MKNRPIITGILAFISPLPMFFFAFILSWILFFGIGMGLLGLSTVPYWMLIPTVLALLVSPTLCVLGIIHGIVKRHVRYAKLGILLSALGLVGNGILWFLMGYLSQF